MIAIYIGFFTLLGIGGLLWYVFYDAISQLIAAAQTYQSGLLESVTLSFIETIWHWLPLFLVIAGLMFVVINSQRGP